MVFMLFVISVWVYVDFYHVKHSGLDANLSFRYGESFPVSAEVLDSSFCLPIGKAKVIIS